MDPESQQRIEFFLEDLPLSARKNLAARHEVGLRKEAAVEDAPLPKKTDLAALFDHHAQSLGTDSPDDVPLDSFVKEAVAMLETITKLPQNPPTLSCATCTGSEEQTCTGTVADTKFVRGEGTCVRPLKMACAIAVSVMQEVYASAQMEFPALVKVRFGYRSKCKPEVSYPYCLEGMSRFSDRASRRVTEILITVGLTHWSLDSYAALTIVLVHELVCHAGHGLSNRALRRGTAPEDSFAEGWMDYVGRIAIARIRDPEILAPLRSVEGVLTDWRLSLKWEKQICGLKTDDPVAADRKKGTKRAIKAHTLFSRRASKPDFFKFSGAFNARVVDDNLRSALLRDVEAVSGLHMGPATHPLLDAIDGYATNGDVDDFVATWRGGMA